jgi:hypothetical protein
MTAVIEPSQDYETRLLLIVILAGTFGSLVHAIRSFYWYAGSPDLRWSWALTYLLLPFSGGILAMLFCFVVRGGFFSSQSTIKDTSPFAFAAFSGLVDCDRRKPLSGWGQVVDRGRTSLYNFAHAHVSRPHLSTPRRRQRGRGK